MPKTIESPVKRFSGTVVLPDALTFPQYNAFNAAMKAVKTYNDAMKAAETNPERSRQNQAMVPGVLACVAEWTLANLTPEQLTEETFPATPYVAVTQLLTWLVKAITDLVFEADGSPNA